MQQPRFFAAGDFMQVHKTITPEDFEQAALPHLNKLFRAAVRMTGNQAESEDLVQEVYLQAWKSFYRFEMGTNCHAWLFKILTNKIKHYYRKNYRFKLVNDSEKALAGLAYTAPTPQSLCDELLLACLGNLPSVYREAIILADVEEFSYKEIGVILDVPIGTVMSRLSRGRKLLRIELERCGEIHPVRQTAVRNIH
ncbi:MAG TPA: sigma-70 family RNA polymerase sigma factor [Pyrinomonadaceae bacterium]|nr:sigma-70 family RNA polymerase sigma factor [Pyrinomonadaceae bacterium]